MPYTAKEEERVCAGGGMANMVAGRQEVELSSWFVPATTCMPICTHCTQYLPFLYTVYESAYNLRLEQCVSNELFCK